MYKINTNEEIISKVHLVSNAPNLLVPKAKPRNTNNISYYYLYSANVPNHLLILNKSQRSYL